MNKVQTQQATQHVKRGSLNPPPSQKASDTVQVLLCNAIKMIITDEHDICK